MRRAAVTGECGFKLIDLRSKDVPSASQHRGNGCFELTLQRLDVTRKIVDSLDHACYLRYYPIRSNGAAIQRNARTHEHLSRQAMTTAAGRGPSSHPRRIVPEASRPLPLPD